MIIDGKVRCEECNKIITPERQNTFWFSGFPIKDICKTCWNKSLIETSAKQMRKKRKK